MAQAEMQDVGPDIPTLLVVTKLPQGNEEDLRRTAEKIQQPQSQERKYITLDEQNYILAHVRSGERVTETNVPDILARIEEKTLRDEIETILRDCLSRGETMQEFFLRYMLHRVTPVLLHHAHPTNFELSFEDMQQEVWMRIGKKLSKYLLIPEPDYEFERSATTIARNYVLDQHGRADRRRKYDMLSLEEEAEKVDHVSGDTLRPSNWGEESTTDRRAVNETVFAPELWKEVAALPYGHRRVLELHYKRDIPVQGVARMLKLLEKAVFMKLLRARRALLKTEDFAETWATY